MKCIRVLVKRGIVPVLKRMSNFVTSQNGDIPSVMSAVISYINCQVSYHLVTFLSNMYTIQNRHVWYTWLQQINRED